MILTYKGFQVRYMADPPAGAVAIAPLEIYYKDRLFGRAKDGEHALTKIDAELQRRMMK